MAKVIVERPRFGSGAPSRKKGYRKYSRPAAWESLPQREPMLGHWRGQGKWLNEHLGPMRRFLRSNIGRPWDHVHRELCEHVSFDNAVQAHVLVHIYDYVRQHVEIVGRDVYGRRSWGRTYKLDPRTMYICPATGLLKEVRAPRRQRRPRRIGAGKPVQFHCRDGVWWELVMRPLPQDRMIIRRHSAHRNHSSIKTYYDVWLERTISSCDAAMLEANYGAKLTAVSKRPLSAKEARAVVEQYVRTAKRRRRDRWSETAAE